MNCEFHPWYEAARHRSARRAVVDERGEHTYQDLMRASDAAAARLLDGRRDLDQERVAFLIPAGVDYVVAQWGIWKAGGVAVPLCVTHPLPELEYVLEDSGASILLLHPRFETLRQELASAAGGALRTIALTESWVEAADAESPADLPSIDQSRRALILYTSGSTGRPKGVVSTHANLRAQIEALVKAWGWTEDDRILHVLPLHHTHGIVNVLSCALASGACCEFMSFDAQRVWERFAEGGLTLFMAVPTIYRRLAAAWQESDSDLRAEWSAACRGFRLMVSGSAALPVPLFELWKKISGHTLLERYGMTEIGMALSNPLEGERRAGTVGHPLPGVDVRLVDEAGREVPSGASGEIEVRGPNVFAEYWGRANETARAFRDGWFRTGDVALIENGCYRILGRSSVDIIKTGGYKVSALEIEDVLRRHPAIRDCAVVGIADADWGERVCAAVCCADDASLNLGDLRRWAKERLAAYKVPSRLICLSQLPRNAMGKVVKPRVRELFQDDS